MSDPSGPSPSSPRMPGQISPEGLADLWKLLTDDPIEEAERKAAKEVAFQEYLKIEAERKAAMEADRKAAEEAEEMEKKRVRTEAEVEAMLE